MSKIRPRNGLIAALDVGTTKICCFIARAQDDGAIKIIGIGHQVSRGMRAGLVVDMEAVEAQVRQAVEAAEDMAGERISQVVIGFTAGQPLSRHVDIDVSVAGHEVSESDIRRMLDHARQQPAESHERELVHCIPLGFRLDGSEGIRDPRGMFGEKLGVGVHLISAASGALKNLATVVARGHLDIDSCVVAPYAAGLATLVDDEKELGATVIDMGGGTTTIAVFMNGQVVHIDSLPVGGGHVTSDIARGLSTPLAQAERLKTLYGSCMPSAADDREMLRVPLVGEEDDQAAAQMPRSMLVQIIRPRIEETFELVRSHLETSGMDRAAGRRVVLVGGASQLSGARELAGMVLDKQVRMGKPQGFAGMAEATGGPAFAVCAGLLRYAVFNLGEAAASGNVEKESSQGRFGRLGQWFRENF
ncbi:MAG: cell division protein FtsA [Alphaproteobacteria bacterium]|nr:cell division protein FtsA [Alphaproteobacteria bacterium]